MPSSQRKVTTACRVVLLPSSQPCGRTPGEPQLISRQKEIKHPIQTSAVPRPSFVVKKLVPLSFCLYCRVNVTISQTWLRQDLVYLEANKQSEKIFYSPLQAGCTPDHLLSRSHRLQHKVYVIQGVRIRYDGPDPLPLQPVAVVALVRHEGVEAD